MSATPTAVRRARLADLTEYLVDDRVGVVGAVEESPRAAGAPDFFHFVARAANTATFSALPNFANAGGAAMVREDAVAKAIGEAVERYCSAIFDVERLPLATAEDAPFDCVDPAEFALHTDAEYDDPGFPWARFRTDTPVRWVPATDLATGGIRHVPAAMVYVPYTYYLDSGDRAIVQPISTGLACHSSPAEAARSAICETVERDAFTITWQARLAARQILVETLSDANYDAVHRFERTGSTVTLLDITTDFAVPTVLALLHSAAPGAPALVVAAAAEPDPELAVRKSLEELAHTRRYSQQIKDGLPRLARLPGYTNVVDQVSHLNFWADHANAELAQFAVASPERVAFDDLPSIATGAPDHDVAALVDRISRAGHQVLIADVTTSDVRDLGLTVVRAIVPGSHPLYMGHTGRARGGRRLWEVPQRLGHRGLSREIGDNPLPHPYP
ncbi:YcaO-like family protein [Pseudonocardia tropica]|uniref:YcaO-like family protein n=1 Tax=Pseudonocardia tropica TaxID=681289 RepID=A0ABV1K251_9PSEU